ncbi:hypothetical protein AKJ40_00930 [candidate division MSBL1 archaeon SCGC-AAA259M10]|nr:hypothetical protein AKJ40_00930 [candidate division MSBL1 archaeon SCGC-AAA259M10]
MIVRKVGPKGQVVIPSDIREMLGIRPGEQVVVEVDDGNVVIKRKEGSIADHMSQLVPEEKKRNIDEIDLDEYYESQIIRRQGTRR